MGVYPHRWSTVLENAEKEPEKKVKLWQDSNPCLLDTFWMPLPNNLWSHTLATRHILESFSFLWGNLISIWVSLKIQDNGRKFNIIRITFDDDDDDDDDYNSNNDDDKDDFELLVIQYIIIITK